MIRLIRFLRTILTAANHFLSYPTETVYANIRTWRLIYTLTMIRFGLAACSTLFAIHIRNWPLVSGDLAQLGDLFTIIMLMAAIWPKDENGSCF